MLRRVAVVRTDVSKELRASFIRVPRIDELGTTLTVTSIPEDTILHSDFQIPYVYDYVQTMQATNTSHSKSRKVIYIGNFG
jgi:hypothetical protein